MDSVRAYYTKEVLVKLLPPHPSSFPAVGSDPERTQVLQLLEMWVRVCHEITQNPSSTNEKCRSYLTHLFAQVSGVRMLLREHHYFAWLHVSPHDILPLIDC
jgi:hypothetical protein